MTSPITPTAIAAALVGSLILVSAQAGPIANWKELNPDAAVVPIIGADSDGPTFGDGVTTNSAQGAWVAGMFGTAGSPVTVTLAVGETLTVTGEVVLTGGSNNSNQFRFGVFADGGQFALDDGNNWVGGWLHSSGIAASSDLWLGRTDGPFISTVGNAVDQDAVVTRSGAFDGDSLAPFSFSMSITRDSATTIDVVSILAGGDGDLSEQYVKEDLTTEQFTYNALGWLLGGSSAVEQAVFSNVGFSVSGGGEARILAIRSDGSRVEIDYEGIAGRAYAIDASTDLGAWPEELDDSIPESGTFIDDLAARLGAPLPPRVFYRLREVDPP